MATSRWVAVLLLAGCSAAPVGQTGAALEDAPVVVGVEGDVVWRPPEGGDGLPHVALRWTLADGSSALVPEQKEPWVAALAFHGVLLALDASRALYALVPGAVPLRIAEDVADGPYVSPSGGIAAYFTDRASGTELWLYDGEVTRRIATGLEGSAGLRFVDSERAIAFISARNFGIAGLWVTPLVPGGARCLTNCAFHVGSDPAGWSKLPRLDSIEVDDTVVRFVDLEGRPRELER